MPDSLPLRLSALPKVPADEEFVCDPELIFDQADFVARHNFGDEVLPLSDYQFLIFSRRVRVIAPSGFKADNRGMMWGEQLVAYGCDSDGDVDSWESRYQVEAHSYEYALRKFRYMLINRLISAQRCAVPEPFADAR